MGAKQNFNLGGINSHFNGLKDAGNMSPTQLALTYSKEQLQHMAQMGVINPTNAVIAGMNIDRISTANAPPTSTVFQNTFALQQGGIISIPRPGQKYQHGGVVAFSNKGEVKAPIYDEVKAPIYDEDEEFKKYKDQHTRARGRNYGERPQFDSNSTTGLMANPEIEKNQMVWKGLTPKERLNMAQRDIQFNKDHPDSDRLNSLIGKEPAGVGALAAQSARPGAGAGNPPAASVLSNVDPAFLDMLKERGGQPMMAHENVQEGSNDALNRALIRGGAAMMANRDPAIGSGLQGFLQTAGKGATEGLTGYEQQIREFKDRKVKQDELAATEKHRTRANEIAAASTGVTYGLAKNEADALPIAAKLKREGEVDVAQISANAKSLDKTRTPYEVYSDPKSTPDQKKQALEWMALEGIAKGRDFSIEQRGKAVDAWIKGGYDLPQYRNLKGAALVQAQEDFVQNYMRRQSILSGGDGGGGGYQPTKNQTEALNRNLPQK